MISTQRHGAIDYGTAALWGVLAAPRLLPVAVRRVLAGAALIHVGYSALTDYEWGLSARLSVGTHRRLDLVGAAGLVGAGLAAGRRRPWSRGLLVGFGVAEASVAMLTRPAARGGPGRRADQQSPRPVYPPLDVLKRIDDDLFVVDSALAGATGRIIAARMTVMRLPDGGLLLHSPTRYGVALRQQLERVGPIRHLVAPSFGHWMFLPAWQRAVPEAAVWAAPGLRERRAVRRSGVRLDHDLDGTPPPAWGGVVDTAGIPGGLGFSEVAFFHRPTRTLVLSDLVMALEPGRLPPGLRGLARWLQMTDGWPPPQVRAIVGLRRDEAATAVRRLLALEPARVIFAHGRPYEEAAAAALAHAVDWLVD